MDLNGDDSVDVLFADFMQAVDESVVSKFRGMRVDEQVEVRWQRFGNLKSSPSQHAAKFGGQVQL